MIYLISLTLLMFLLQNKNKSFVKMGSSTNFSTFSTLNLSSWNSFNDIEFPLSLYSKAEFIEEFLEKDLL